MKIQHVRMIEADHIEKQATLIRDVAQSIIEACQAGKVIDSYARNVVAGGDLAKSAAVLGMMIVQYEHEEG